MTGTSGERVQKGDDKKRLESATRVYNGEVSPKGPFGVELVR